MVSGEYFYFIDEGIRLLCLHAVTLTATATYAELPEEVKACFILERMAE